MNLSYVAVAYFLPSPISKNVVWSSHALHRYCGSWYVLDELAFPPHMTLWIAYVPSKNLGEMIRALSEVARRTNAFTISYLDPKIDESGYALVPAVLNDTLRELHLTLLRTLNPFREGYIPEKYLSKIETYPPDQRQSIRMFGTRFAGDLYNPHVSIGFVPPGDKVTAQKYLPNTFSSDTIVSKSIVMFRQKEEGRSIELLTSAALLST